MTAKSSQKLADALRSAGFEELAQRAELDEFHDYKSPHDLPAMALNIELTALGPKATPIRQKFLNGDFDATDEESDEWAASPEGQDAFARLVRDK
jgi:hypothetical protein